MTHLTADELVDLVEGTLGPDRQTHVDHCAACGKEAARLGGILREVQDVAVPEPSPLFWTHLSARVGQAIAAEDAATTVWSPAWLGWRVLAPVGALAMLILALATAVPRQPAASPETPAAVANAAKPPVDLAAFGDQEWAVVSEIVGPVDLDAAQHAGIVRLGDAERAALQLSVVEQRELVRLLQEEMEKVGG